MVAEPVRVRKLTDQEGQKLQQIVRRGSTSSVRYRRAMMLLASSGGNRVPVIAKLVQADEDTVRDAIHRFNEIGPACLDPRRAGGRPRLLSSDDEDFVIQTATTRPTEPGQPFTRWSIRKLAAYLRKVHGRAIPDPGTARLSALAQRRHPLGRQTHHRRGLNKQHSRTTTCLARRTAWTTKTCRPPWRRCWRYWGLARARTGRCRPARWSGAAGRRPRTSATTCWPTRASSPRARPTPTSPSICTCAPPPRLPRCCRWPPPAADCSAARWPPLTRPYGPGTGARATRRGSRRWASARSCCTPTTSPADWAWTGCRRHHSAQPCSTGCSPTPRPASPPACCCGAPDAGTSAVCPAGRRGHGRRHGPAERT
ncbi:hypothetical protein SCOCK_50177 [Actinacidiphila cocklensis]|uniref:Transposase n=1 Tax=Actinacidiphila cocklensis TaxID=887465 RepID=A0A9W4DVV3_9ACTN|nr:hypothetical protein SCOCK_50177 [Actinacidiphila cocklensis]